MNRHKIKEGDVNSILVPLEFLKWKPGRTRSVYKVVVMYRYDCLVEKEDTAGQQEEKRMVLHPPYR